MICGEDQDPHNRRNMAIEIVDLGGPGTTACAQESSGVNRYRAGWEAASPCDCDNDWDADHTVNCAGFGMRSGTPSPPPPTVLRHCADGDQHGWPSFHTQADLQANKPWADYIRAVYGEVPNSGYPICTYSLSQLYKPLLEAAGVQLPAMSDRCPTHAGQYYSTMTDHEEKWSTWIWNFNLAQPLTFDLPSNTWVEIIHQGYELDGDAAWLYYTPGTAIWINLGTTQAYLDHGDATLALLNEPCQGGGTGGEDLPNECIPQFPRLYKAAIAQGLDTLQFLKHADMICGEDQNPHNRRNMAIEIVDLGGPGTTACAQESSGVNRYRAGWEAASPCDCDNDWDADHTVNCAGFGMRSGTPPSPPSPPPPPPTVLRHCADGDQHGWPSFHTQADLQANKPWADYIRAVYGEVPNSGYPICTFPLSQLYKPLLEAAGVQLPAMSDR